MKLEIAGKQYDIAEGMQRADLYTLFELKSKYGIGIKSMLAAAQRFEEIEDRFAILEDEDLFRTFLAMIWLARRYAGEKLTLEEANSIPLDGLKFVAEEGDEVADPHQALTVSAQGDERHVAVSTSHGKSKTSKAR